MTTSYHAVEDIHKLAVLGVKCFSISFLLFLPTFPFCCTNRDCYFWRL